MHKIIVLTSVFAIFGTANAFAFDAALGFGPSDANDQPVPRFQMGAQVDRSTLTAGIDRSFGFPADRSVGFSAAQGFGPSDANDQPVPRFQIAR